MKKIFTIMIAMIMGSCSFENDAKNYVYVVHYNPRTNRYAVGSDKPLYSDVYVYINDVKGKFFPGVSLPKEFKSYQEAEVYLENFEKWKTKEKALPTDKFIPLQDKKLQ